jgi:SPP1 family predicted phage head-tail adaptor
MPINEIRIRAGRLRQLIEIVEPGASRDSFGGFNPSSGTSLGTVWASIEAVSGRDALAAQAFASVGTHLVTIRWMDGVAASQVVKFGTRTFQIQAVLNPDERTKVLKLLCTEINDSKQQGN